MSLRRAFRERRPGWPLVLLALSLGATAIAAVQAYLTVRSQQTVMRNVLREYAGFASWSFQQHLVAELGTAAREAIGAVNHGDEMHTSPRIPHAAEVGHYLPWDMECECHRAEFGPQPAYYFGFTLGADTVGVGANYYRRHTHGWLAEALPREMHAPDAERLRGSPWLAWVNDTVTAQVRSGFLSGSGYTYVVARHGGHVRYLAYTLMPTTWGDTLVYGVEYTPDAFASILAGVLDGRGLLPETFSRAMPNRRLLALEVRTPGGDVVLPGGTREWGLDATHALPRDFGGLRVRAQIRPEAAGALIIGGLPRSRLPFLLGLLALAAALSAVAVAQLRREQEMARTRADFVSAVSHELRTPLAQIRLFLETLRLGRADTAEARDWSLDQIDRETRRLAQLVENVLRFHRRGRPGAEPPRERVELAAELGRIIADFRPLAAARGAEVRLEADAPAASLASRDGLRQVLLNLLDNAVKFGPAGQTVRVRLEVGDDAPAHARITVSDQGPGVPPEEREAIWQPFRRGSSCATRAVGGSGIGLTIAREIVAEHGGDVRVEDAPGGGARFVVRLPLAPAAATGGALAPEAAPAGAAP